MLQTSAHTHVLQSAATVSIKTTHVTEADVTVLVRCQLSECNSAMAPHKFQTRSSNDDYTLHTSSLLSVKQHNCSSSSSSSSALQPSVGLGLFKQKSPATSTLCSRQVISTNQFPGVFIYPVNPSWFGRSGSRCPPWFVHNTISNNPFSSVRTIYPAHPNLLDFY